MVTVPAPTSRPPRDLAEDRSQTPIPASPIFPSERAESEEPFHPSLRPEEEELAEAPVITKPVPMVPERATAAPTTRRPSTVVGYPPIEDPREQVEALNNATERLQMAVTSAEEAADRREHEFQQREDERMRMFLDNEAQRNEEARERTDAIWRHLEERLAALPPVPLKPVPLTPVPLTPLPGEHVDLVAEKPETEEERAETESIEPVPLQGSAPYGGDIMEMIQLARDEFGKERERQANERIAFFDELRAEKDREIEEKTDRIRMLEEEVQQLRADFQAERQQHLTEDADRREQERQERIGENNDIRAQLNDLTNLSQQSRNMIEEKKATSDERYHEKEARRQDKDAQLIELRDMIQKIHDDREIDRARYENDREIDRARYENDRQKDTERLEGQNEDLQRQVAELQELLRTFAEGELFSTTGFSVCLTRCDQVGEQIAKGTMTKLSKLFEQLPISRYHLMCKAYVVIQLSNVHVFIGSTI